MKRGLTLLEIMITIAILGLVATIIFSSFSKLNASQAVGKSAGLLVSILNQARSLTLGAEDDAQYGVHLEASKAVLFKGASFSANDPANITSELNGLVGITDITLSDGGSDVLFERLTGKAVQNGSLKIALRSDNAVSKTIIIYQSGLSEIN